MNEDRAGKPVVTNALITACVLVYVVTLFVPVASVLNLLETFGLVPSRLLVGANPLNLVLYSFIHVHMTHLVSNMFMLYSVGREVEMSVGSRQFGVVYLVSGVAAGLIHAVFNSSSTTPVIGASGAIFGAIAVLLLLMPFKITTALLIPLPGVVMGLMLLIVEVLSILVSPEVGVAHDIHLYGFFVGALTAFAIDYDKALRGLVIAVVILVALYIWAIYLDGLTVFV